MSRLTIDITDQQRERLQASAALHGKSIAEYAVDQLFPADTDAELAWGELKSLLRQRIARGADGAVSMKTIDDIVAEELGPDGEA